MDSQLRKFAFKISSPDYIEGICRTAIDKGFQDVRCIGIPDQGAKVIGLRNVVCGIAVWEWD